MNDDLLGDYGLEMAPKFTTLCLMDISISIQPSTTPTSKSLALVKMFVTSVTYT